MKFFFFCSALLFSVSAVAAENSAWLEFKQQSHGEVKKCADVWEGLWPFAKERNLEARVMLYNAMVIGPDTQQLLAPGNTGDLVTKIRDIVIMAVHSEDYKSQSERDDFFRSAAHSFYELYGFKSNPQGEKFMQCVEENLSDNCADIAVKAKLVPSFEEYSKQIDAFLEQGMQSSCTQ